MIIGRDLMVQLGLAEDFKHQFLQWYFATVHMKEPSGVLGQYNLYKREMHEVFMQNAEPAFTREATKIMVNTLYITYVKAELKQVVDNTTHLNAEERNQLLSLIEDLKDVFGGSLGDQATETVKKQLKACYKPFNNRYYLVPITNKDFFENNLNAQWKWV